MRVVCDNCGAVYKIANSKLSKEVNRATCKRCGHKIIIYKPGSRAAEEAAAARTAPDPVDDDEERTVIKSVPDLQKMASQQQGSMPSIGSLTAELRAISIPGIESVDGPSPTSPATLGPAGPEADTRPPPPALAPLPSQVAPLPPGPPKMPPVMQATAIPASDSPKTKLYSGPGPTVGTQGPPSAPKPPMVGSPDPTRPMPLPVTGPVPSNGAGGPVPKFVAPAPMPAPIGSATTGPTPAPAVAAVSAATAAAPVAPSGAPVLGLVSMFGTLGLIGLVAVIFVPWPATPLAYGLAAFGVAACLTLSTVTARGSKPKRAPVALVLAFFLSLLVAGLQFVYAGGIEWITGETAPPTPTVVVTKPVLPPVEPPPTEVPETSGVAGDPGGAALDAEELEAARRFSADEVASLGAEPTAGKESKADVVTRPTPSARTTPRPSSTPRSSSASTSPTPTPAPSGPSRPALSEPAAGGDAPKAEGPSPFVIDTIIRNNAAIVRCLRVEEAKGVDLSGKIYLKFTIAPDGGVSKARVTTSRFAGTSLDSCISRELNNLKFPPFDGTPKKITYPLIVQ